jgi:hypothetical protein
MVCTKGRRKTRASMESVREVQRPPVMAKALALCMLVNFFVILTVPLILVVSVHCEAAELDYIVKCLQ